MTKKSAERYPIEIKPEPTITYERNLKLLAYHPTRINLGHLRALVREAAEKGFTDDCCVRVSSGGYSSDYQVIEVEASQ